MSDQSDYRGLRDRVAAQTEDTLGKLAQDLLENPVVHGAIARAFVARERATQAQELAMGALNLPSAADLERLTRRLRSVSQRLEGIEDGVDRLDRSLTRLSVDQGVPARLAGLEEQLTALTRMVADLRESLPGTNLPVPRAQERLAVGAADASPPTASGTPRVSPRRSGPRAAAKSRS